MYCDSAICIFLDTQPIKYVFIATVFPKLVLFLIRSKWGEKLQVSLHKNMSESYG